MSSLVLREIRTAADSGVRLLLVLVEGARMVGSDTLPPDIAALADVQASTLDRRHYDRDVEQLCRLIDGILGFGDEVPRWDLHPDRGRRLRRAGGKRPKGRADPGGDIAPSTSTDTVPTARRPGKRCSGVLAIPGAPSYTRAAAASERERPGRGPPSRARDTRSGGLVT